MELNLASSITKGKFWILPILAAVVLSGCNPLQQSAPLIESIFIEEPSIATTLYVNQLPVDWEEANANLTAIEILLKEKFDLPSSQFLSQMGIELQQIETIAASAFYPSMDCTTQSPSWEGLKPNWILAIDLSVKMDAKELETRVNQLEGVDVKVEKASSLGGFDRFDLQYQNKPLGLSVALHPGKNPQLRFGAWEHLEKSITEPSTASILEKEMLSDQQPHMWTHVRIPPEFSAWVQKVKGELPFEPEVLLGGFESVTTSFFIQGDTLFTATALQFESKKQSDTAFSYSQLGSSFVVKPYLRKETKGAADHFVDSIELKNDGQYTRLYMAINREDFEALETLAQNQWVSLAGDALFDLIPQR